MKMDMYAQFLCDMMQSNYDDAVQYEARFQEWFQLQRVEDVHTLIEDLAKEGDWPEDEKGKPYMPKDLVEKVVEDKDFFKNIGLLIIIGRIWTRLEIAHVLSES